MAASAIPMVSYEDVDAAARWLSDAFGFAFVSQPMTDEAGRTTHAEIALEGATVFLGWPGSDYMDPSHHAAVCDEARAWSRVPWVIDGVFIRVDDVDAHFDRARERGATILREPEDLPPGRLYSAADPFGHRWMFASR
jgi:uncharacterized glyoxalase superfamily protein PhnB